MKTTPSRKPKQEKEWPKKVLPGCAIVAVYCRRTPAGNYAFMVSNYAEGNRRRFDSYATEAAAVEAAEKLAKRLDARDYVAAGMTREQAIEYAHATQVLAPYNVGVSAATAAVAECLKTVGDLANTHAACRFFAARHKRTVKKLVPDAMAIDCGAGTQCV